MNPRDQWHSLRGCKVLSLAECLTVVCKEEFLLPFQAILGSDTKMEANAGAWNGSEGEDGKTEDGEAP